MRALLTVTQLTLHEAGRRRILLAALICGVAFVGLFATGFHFIVLDMKKDAARNTSLELRMMLTFFTCVLPLRLS